MTWRPFGCGLALATAGFLMPLGWLPAGREVPSVLPQLPIPGDKLAHAAVFAVLMLLGLWALDQQHTAKSTDARAPLLVGAARLFALLMLYAIAIEGLQIVVPTRGAEWMDLVADCVGCLAALPLLWLWLRRLRQ